MTKEEFRAAVLKDEVKKLAAYVNARQNEEGGDFYCMPDDAYFSELVSRIYTMGREEMATDMRDLLKEGQKEG